MSNEQYQVSYGSMVPYLYLGLLVLYIFGFMGNSFFRWVIFEVGTFKQYTSSSFIGLLTVAAIEIMLFF